MRLAQIEYLAGYTELATLVRAFKRWTGRRRQTSASGRASRCKPRALQTVKTMHVVSPWKFS